MSFFDQLRLPIFQAPMFRISGPEMVIAAAKSGIIGSFPAPNARTLEELEVWLKTISSTLASDIDEQGIAMSYNMPWAINLIVHRSNPRWQQDLELAIKYKVPIVISALGSPKDVVDEVHAYGGIIIADVNSTQYSRKAIAAGVDGLALVCAGAGGHTGQLSPFAFVEEVRRFWPGMIVLSGAISTGRGIAAALAMGANYVYMGTRFITTSESLAEPDYKKMIVQSKAQDIICSDTITGVKANWMRDSLSQAGFDPDNMPSATTINFAEAASDRIRWKEIWSAGQGVGAINNVKSIAELVDQLEAEYQLTNQNTIAH